MSDSMNRRNPLPPGKPASLIVTAKRLNQQRLRANAQLHSIPKSSDNKPDNRAQIHRLLPQSGHTVHTIPRRIGAIGHCHVTRAMPRMSSGVLLSSWHIVGLELTELWSLFQANTDSGCSITEYLDYHILPQLQRGAWPITACWIVPDAPWDVIHHIGVLADHDSSHVPWRKKKSYRIKQLSIDVKKTWADRGVEQNDWTTRLGSTMKLLVEY